LLLHSRSPRRSAAANWAPLNRFIGAEDRLARWAAQRPVSAFIYEFIRFGVKQAWACLFGGALLALIVVTHLWYPRDAALARYDFLFLSALAIQATMLSFRLETWEEARVILLFHVVGTIMEVFKTSVGSWVYPEASFFRIGDVPLFSGFMYAAIGSYMARAWRLFDFRFTRHPPLWTLFALALAIYANFYAHHYTVDVRYGLFVLAALLFCRTMIHYRVWEEYRQMPLLLACFLTAVFVWIAENIGTATKTWTYPHQAVGWSMVSLGKLGSWFLLLFLSYALVAIVNRPTALAAAGDDKATAHAASMTAYDATSDARTSEPTKMKESTPAAVSSASRSPGRPAK
jgi:uncharacterized membrane protein YoaT (DUF817 family)